jgi:predicted MPP superfamily phosphohydrolase
MRAPLLAGVLLLALLQGAAGARAEARQVHLSLAPDGYTVTFESPTPLADPRVRYTTSQGSADAAAQRATPPAGDNDAVYFAHLPADATSYTIEGRLFHVHAPASSDRLRVVVMADMGRSPDSWRLWSLAQEQAPDLILLPGDLSYANGNADQWDEWFSHVEGLAATVPVMTALGNHETYCSPDGVKLDSCAKEAFGYLEHFHMAAGDQLYHDFSLGPAHFTSLDTEAYHPGDSHAPAADKAAQNAFLQASLQRAGDQWRIVYFHRPLYSSNVHTDDLPDPAAKADWRPILDANGADLVLNGHAHAYERSYPLRDDAIAETTNVVPEGKGIVYVTTGGGGRSLYTEFASPPDWSAKRAAEYELVVLDVTPESIVGKALREDGSLLDTFAVYRGATPPTLASVQQSTGGHGVPALDPLAVAGAVALLAWARRRARGA